MTEGIAAFVAWLGASVIVLSDGRRGLALGTALAGVGLAGVVWQDSGPLAAAAIAVGGGIAAARRVRAGDEGWRVMPPGSTPRFILCVAGGLVALWIALGVTSGHSAALRFAVLTVMGLAATRTLSIDAPPVLLTAVAVIALGLASAAGLAEGGSGPWPYLAAAILAAFTGWMRPSVPRAA